MENVIETIADNDEAYFAFKGISASQLKTFETAGAYEFWKHSPFNPEKQVDTETDALIFGKYCHCKLFEPAEVEKRFLVFDWGTKTRTTAKYKKAAEENPDKILITPEESMKAELMIASLKSHKVAYKYLNGCECEKPFLWTDEKTRLKCKAKLDGFKKFEDRFLIVDYKTSSDIESLLCRAEKFQYPMQAEFYKRAIRSKYGDDAVVDFIFIIQSSKDGEEDKICVAYVNNETAAIASDIVDRDMEKIVYLLAEYEVNKDKKVFDAYPNLMEIKYSNYYMNGNL